MLVRLLVQKKRAFKKSLESMLVRILVHKKLWMTSDGFGGPMTRLVKNIPSGDLSSLRDPTKAREPNWAKMGSQRGHVN